MQNYTKSDCLATLDSARQTHGLRVVALGREGNEVPLLVEDLLAVDGDVEGSTETDLSGITEVC